MTQERRSVKITIVVSSCEDCQHKEWDQDGIGQCGIDGYGDWLHARETYSQNSDSPTGLTDSCPLRLQQTAPQPTENLRCKSTQKRLATLWGYEKPQHRQPLTNEQIIAIADNARAAESGDAGYILPIAFAHAIEAAHGITGKEVEIPKELLK